MQNPVTFCRSANNSPKLKWQPLFVPHRNGRSEKATHCRRTVSTERHDNGSWMFMFVRPATEEPRQQNISESQSFRKTIVLSLSCPAPVGSELKNGEHSKHNEINTCLVRLSAQFRGIQWKVPKGLPVCFLFWDIAGVGTSFDAYETL